MLEAAIIVIGVVSLLAVVTLRRDLAGAPGTDTAWSRRWRRSRPSRSCSGELSLGLWLVAKGFKPSPIATGMAEPKVAT